MSLHDADQSLIPDGILAVVQRVRWLTVLVFAAVVLGIATAVLWPEYLGLSIVLGFAALSFSLLEGAHLVVESNRARPRNPPADATTRRR